MWKVTENPPLTSYYIALAGGILGWSEAILHAAFLLPAVTVIVGTFRLARYFCESPMLAALATFFTPVFLISCTTVMCDVPMLAFWIWAVVFWVEGLQQNNARKLLAAAVLLALALVTKYYSICLIPLLCTYSFAARRPVALLDGCHFYQSLVVFVFSLSTGDALAIMALYPLFSATDYGLSKEMGGFVFSSACLIGVAFTGGCIATALFFAPLLWQKKTWIFLIVAIPIAGVVFFDHGLLEKYKLLAGSTRMAVQFQLVILATTGLSVLVLAFLRIFRKHRDARNLCC